MNYCICEELKLSNFDNCLECHKQAVNNHSFVWKDIKEIDFDENYYFRVDSFMEEIFGEETMKKMKILFIKNWWDQGWSVCEIICKLPGENDIFYYINLYGLDDLDISLFGNTSFRKLWTRYIPKDIKEIIQSRKE